MSKLDKPFAGVLFDLDDTLNDRNASLHVFRRKLLREYEARLNALRVDTMHQFLIEADGRGYRLRS